MNNYALTLVLKPEMDEKERKELLESVTKKMEKVEKEDVWGSRDLTYPIKKQTKGYYVHYFFSADPEKIASIDKSLKVEEDIIRFLLVKI